MTNTKSLRSKIPVFNFPLLPVGLISDQEKPSYDYKSSALSILLPLQEQGFPANRPDIARLNAAFSLGASPTASASSNDFVPHLTPPAAEELSSTPPASSRHPKIELQALILSADGTPAHNTLSFAIFSRLCAIASDDVITIFSEAQQQGIDSPVHSHLPYLGSSRIKDVSFISENHLHFSVDAVAERDGAPLAAHFIQVDRRGNLPKIIKSSALSPEGLTAIDVPLYDHFTPLLIVCSDVGGIVASCSILPFPSFCRGGLHSDAPLKVDTPDLPTAASPSQPEHVSSEVERIDAAPHFGAKILFVANGIIPTLQLSFLKPLKTLIEQELVTVSTVTSEDFKRLFPTNSRSPQAIDWLKKQLDESAPDVIIFCRYNGLHAPVIRDYANKNGIPIIFHIDDDLLNVPVEIGVEKYRWHNAKERLETIRYLLDNADLIYCSTQPLVERFKSFGIQSRMEYGNVYCASAVMVPATRRRFQKVGYMGFDHAHDLELILEALVAFLDERPDVQFELFGSIPVPELLKRFGDRIRVHAPVRGYEDFLKYFSTLSWDIGIAPLVDSPFNSVKANTKWVEYTSVGAAVIASRGTVYDRCCDRDCGILASGTDEWLNALRKLADSDEDRLSLVSNAQQKLMDDYSVERLRDQIVGMVRIAQDIAQPKSVGGNGHAAAAASASSGRKANK